MWAVPAEGGLAMTRETERRPIPREPGRTRMSDDSRPDPAAAVEALERKVGIPLQIAGAPHRMSGDPLDEPPD